MEILHHTGKFSKKKSLKKLEKDKHLLSEVPKVLTNVTIVLKDLTSVRRGKESEP